MCSQEDKEISELLNKYLSIEKIPESNKLRCRLTGHEMPCTKKAVEQYVSGKKYQKLKSSATFDWSMYKEHIVPSEKKNQKGNLFCKLTCRHLNDLPHHIERHISGRRFQKAYKRWQECEKTGEKFVPLRFMNRQKINKEESDDNDEMNDERDESQHDDDLTDLYPPEDFASDDGSESGSDYDMDLAVEPDNAGKENGQEKATKKNKQDQKKKKTKGNNMTTKRKAKEESPVATKKVKVSSEDNKTQKNKKKKKQQT